MNISVVIPTHNRERELRRAVQSVCRQTVLPEELIIIDDGSEPAVTVDDFEGYNRELDIKLLRNKEAMGANHARNRGIREACGKWIAFLDDDDEYLPTKIEEVSNVIETSGDKIDLVYHPSTIQMVNEKVSYTTKPKELQPQDDVFKALLIKNYIGGTPMVVVKRSKLIDAGLFDEELQSLQDYELWIRLAKEDAKFKLLNSVLTRCYYVTERKSVSKSLNRNIKSIETIENKYSPFYGALTSEDIKEHNAWKYDMQIHKTYLNKRYIKAVTLNFKALFKLRKPKYLLGVIASLLGPKIIFKLRALKG